MRLPQTVSAVDPYRDSAASAAARNATSPETAFDEGMEAPKKVWRRLSRASSDVDLAGTVWAPAGRRTGTSGLL
jgi:hypothetical protein